MPPGPLRDARSWASLGQKLRVAQCFKEPPGVLRPRGRARTTDREGWFYFLLYPSPLLSLLPRPGVGPLLPATVPAFLLGSCCRTQGTSLHTRDSQSDAAHLAGPRLRAPEGTRRGATKFRVMRPRPAVPLCMRRQRAGAGRGREGVEGCRCGREAQTAGETPATGAAGVAAEEGEEK